jgi:adenylate dimethylallyltransferase
VLVRSGTEQARRGIEQRTAGGTRVAVQLVLGPTGVGKTQLSDTLAAGHEHERAPVPVVVLDRIQCHPDLAVGSGRSDRPRRWHLDPQRPLAAGELSPDEAWDRAVELIDKAVVEFDAAIVEGGSMSMVARLAQRWQELQCDSRSMSVTVVRPASRAWHERRVRQRVREMIGDGGPGTMVAEAHRAAADPATYALVATIVGYRELLTAACPLDVDALVEAITAAHLQYAAAQLRGLDRAAATLVAAGVPVRTVVFGDPR